MGRDHACLFKPLSPYLASWDPAKISSFFVLGTNCYRRTIYRAAARVLQILDLPDTASRDYTFSTYMTLTGYELRLHFGPFFYTAWSKRGWEMNLVSGRVEMDKALRDGSWWG